MQCVRLVHALRWRHMVHLIVEWLVNDRTIIQDHVGFINILSVKERKSMLHPDLIISVWVILMSMCTTRLLASFSTHHLLAGLVEEILQLKRLNEVSVPDHGAVDDAHILVLLHNLWDFFCAFEQIIRIAVNWRKLLHCHLQFPPQDCGWNWAFCIPDLVHASDRLLTCTCWQRDCGAVWLHELCRGICRLTSKDHQVKQ
mmetsp:Transcript_153405/g.285913  ORF Transcript_153405/g.285913 Transcript_153405/m.285913 type:complete len:200 (+) Transcript_153405:99-698(+)